MENTAETAPKKKGVIKKILDVLFYVVICAVIVVALAYTVVTLSTTRGVTKFFGYVTSSVQSGSMSGTFEIGDYIVCKEVAPADIKVGDVLSFYYLEPESEQVIVNTHRVIEIREDGKYVMQGDVSNKANSVDDIQVISAGDVIARYTGFKIPKLGKVTDFLHTDVGFFTCVLIPALLFLFWQIYVFAKTLTEARRLNQKKAVNDEARALAEQMLKEMQSGNSAENGEDKTE